jgi:diguanylate cyclase (GGDEF)-like protein/PAS domain S-box-containing protein
MSQTALAAAARRPLAAVTARLRAAFGEAAAPTGSEAHPAAMQRPVPLPELHREHELTLRVLFAEARDAMLICDPAGRIVVSNQAAQALLGHPAAELANLTLQDIRAPAEGDDTFPFVDGNALMRRHDGSMAEVSMRLQTLTYCGAPACLVTLCDLRDRRQHEERLAYMANYDSLTGLPNRSLFRDRLAQAMERARRSNAPMALMFLDLDRFKVVNDSLGHEVGDRLLQHVAEVLTSSLRKIDTVGRQVARDPFTLSRLGGDEFTVIVESVMNVEHAAMIASRLLEALAVPFVVGEEELHISASIGISMYPTDDVDLDGMIRHTDMAMYRSKSLGRNTYSFFSDDLNAAVGIRLSLEGSLRRAIERTEFLLHYQPKADLVSGRITGVEALLRWHCPGRGMVPPDRFISVLEDTGLILQVGAWVIRTACAQLAEWDNQGLPKLSLAVNLSARQLRQPHLSTFVEDTLLEHSIEPGRLEIELTESLAMEDTDVTRHVLGSFARVGVRLAIDDFGTGYSSLAYLRKLDVDTLKVDRSFVGQIPQDTEDCAIATAVIALGHSLHMRVVAEGVETQEQADFLRGLGCDEIQGWLLSRALPSPELAGWLLAYETQRLSRDKHHVFGGDVEQPTLFDLQMATIFDVAL